MNMSPSILEQLARERQRDMIAQASRHRLAREARSTSIPTGQTERAQRRTGRLLRRVRPVISPS